MASRKIRHPLVEPRRHQRQQHHRHHHRDQHIAAEPGGAARLMAGAAGCRAAGPAGAASGPGSSVTGTSTAPAPGRAGASAAGSGACPLRHWAGPDCSARCRWRRGSRSGPSAPAQRHSSSAASVPGRRAIRRWPSSAALQLERHQLRAERAGPGRHRRVGAQALAAAAEADRVALRAGHRAGQRLLDPGAPQLVVVGQRARARKLAFELGHQWPAPATAGCSPGPPWPA